MLDFDVAFSVTVSPAASDSSEILVSENGCCPVCGWDHENSNRSDSNPVIKDQIPHWELGYCGGMDWTEEWVCEECGTRFEFKNGNA